jgi:U3 small nucleolar ribonucleoprotein component
MTDELSEAQKFDKVVRTLLSVSHKEIQRRDKEWRRKRAQKKRAKTSPAVPASDSKV